MVVRRPRLAMVVRRPHLVMVVRRPRLVMVVRRPRLAKPSGFYLYFFKKAPSELERRGTSFHHLL